MAKRTYEFEILARIEKALASANELQEKSNKALAGISFNTAVTAISEGFRVIEDVAGEVFHKISEFTEEAIASANANEEANIRLANSLRVMGDLSSSAVQRFDRLADSISSTTKFTENQVKGSVALAKQYQLTNSETERTIKVATDLAAITGGSLDEATRKVAATFNGFVDRDLARVIPGLKNLGLQTLVTGGALGLIQERVHGTAVVLGNTFSGALGRAKEQLDNIFGTLGDFIVKNPAIIAGINAIGAGFRAFNEELKKNGTQIRGIITDGFLLMIQAAPLLIVAIEKVNEVFNRFQVGGARIATVLTGVFNLAKNLNNDSAKRSIFRGMVDDLDLLDKKFFEDQDVAEKFFGPLVLKTQELVDKTTKAVNAARDLKPAFTDSGGAIEKSISGVEERMKGLADQFRQQIENISKDPVTVGFDLFIRKKIDLTKDDAIALGVGLVNQVVKGAQGAQAAISGVIGGIADLLLPGIGAVVGQIVDVLGQGPEKTKEMVDGFVQSIPTIIDNIVKALPVLIEELVRTLPPALAKAMPEVAIGLTVGIVQHIPEIIRGFITGLIEAAKNFVQELIHQITGALSGGGGGGLFGGGGGAGLLSGSGIPVVSQIGDFLGLADGGRIPDAPQLGGDRALVRLNRNEQVLNGDLTDRLEKYLDANESGGKDIHVHTTVEMGGAQFAKAMYTVRKAGHRV